MFPSNKTRKIACEDVLKNVNKNCLGDKTFICQRNTNVGNRHLYYLVLLKGHAFKKEMLFNVVVISLVMGFSAFRAP